MKNSEKDVLQNLSIDKVSLPSLSDVSKAKITNAIMTSIIEDQKVEQSKTNRFSGVVWLTAAVVLLSFSVWYFLGGKGADSQKVETIASEVPNKPVVAQQKEEVKVTIDAEAVRLVVEKLDPDRLGGLASRVLESEGQLKLQIANEINALSTISNKILSNFYDEFRPATQKEAAN